MLVRIVQSIDNYMQSRICIVGIYHGQVYQSTENHDGFLSIHDVEFNSSTQPTLYKDA